MLEVGIRYILIAIRDQIISYIKSSVINHIIIVTKLESHLLYIGLPKILITTVLLII